jgi:HD-GYP domain-containing protein (c-di-GMP phosphodiesterase class II)
VNIQANTLTPSNVTLSIDSLIEIVNQGGKVKTGIDIFSPEGILLLGQNALIQTPQQLIFIKKNGISEIPINQGKAGGVWDQSGREIEVKSKATEDLPYTSPTSTDHSAEKMKHLSELKHEATEKFSKAKESIKKVIQDIKETGGEFDYDAVQTTVTDLFTFITRNDSAFFYLTKEIFSYDDYLYHHCINVCTIGTAILKKFNEQFNGTVTVFSPEDSFQIAIGFFLHDVGKVLIPDHILNKTGKLTVSEFELIKTHSFEKGMIILEKNRIADGHIKDIVKYHHSALIAGEPNCYPADKPPSELPREVKICKLADIYDAMTSRRVYKDALNPAGVVAEIVRKYAKKEADMQLLLYAFVKLVGIYPAGSIVFLTNHQMAYILDSDGPLVIPFTDPNGNWLAKLGDPMDLGEEGMKDASLELDVTKTLLSPAKAFALIPENLKLDILNYINV